MKILMEFSVCCGDEDGSRPTCQPLITSVVKSSSYSGQDALCGDPWALGRPRMWWVDNLSQDATSLVVRYRYRWKALM